MMFIVNYEINCVKSNFSKIAGKDGERGPAGPDGKAGEKGVLSFHEYKFR